MSSKQKTVKPVMGAYKDHAKLNSSYWSFRLVDGYGMVMRGQNLAFAV